MRTLIECETLAEKILCKHFPIMSKDHEAIGKVVEYILKAEQKYDPTLSKRMTENTWVVYYGKLGARKYYNDTFLKRQKEQKKVLSLDYVYDDGINLEKMIGKNSPPEQSLMCEEIMTFIKNNTDLTTTQKQCFMLKNTEYKTYRDIGKKLGISYEMARLNNNKVIKKVREAFE